jgi:RES domain-containing protein
MRVWRIASATHADFDGEGARRHGSRWTPRGLPAVYTSATLSLAALERFVHADPDLEPDDLVATSVDVPDDVAVGSVEITDLPPNWREYPSPEALQAIGAAWVQRAASAVLSVPSVVIPHERNYILNPVHPDFGRLAIGKAEAFSFDPRMWKARKRKRAGGAGPTR